MRFDICGLTNATRGLSHEELLRHMEGLEALGYGGVWFNEFHFKPHSPYPSTLMLASAVFARTTRLRVGTSVIVPAIYHPLMLAEFIAQLTRQSGGRLDVGMGRASNTRTMNAFGYAREDAGEAFRLAVTVMRQAWRGAVQLPPNAHWRAGMAAVGPLLEGPEPALSIGAKSLESCLFAAGMGLPLLLATQWPDEAVMAAYRAALPDPAIARGISFSRFVCIGETQNEAQDRVDRLIWAIHADDLAHARRLGRDETQVVRPDRARFIAERAIVGTPDECAVQIDALRTAHEVSQMRLMFADAYRAGVNPSPDTELFARAVMPAF